MESGFWETECEKPFFFETDLQRGITRALLNRPKRCNALSLSVLQEFAVLLCELEHRPEIRILLIKGKGDHFCSGLDLSEASSGEFLTLPEEDAFRFFNAELPKNLFSEAGEKKEKKFCSVPKSFWMPRMVIEILLRLIRLPQIVIGAAQGGVFGGGGGILASCDIAIASPNMKIGFPESRRGLSAGLLHPFLRRRTAPNCLLPLLLTGTAADAATALRIGLIDSVVPCETALTSEAERIADQVLCGEPERIRELKRVRNSEENLSDLEAVSGLLNHWESWKSRVAEEGVCAFLEKRTPVWR